MLVLFALLSSLNKKDTSYIAETNTPLKVEDRERDSSQKLQSVKTHNLVSSLKAGELTLASSNWRAKTKDRLKQSTSKGSSYGSSYQADMKYKAKQVIFRKDYQVLAGDSLPTGTNLIGQLLTAIDTRDKGQMVKVILPYGGTFKGKRILARNTVLLGRIRYQSKGSKVFVTFDKGVSPKGLEFAIKAQALSSKDYSSGLVGDYHSQADLRFFATMGISMLSKAGDVLTEREALSENSFPTPKATVRNAALQGMSKGLEMESSRKAKEMQNQKGYVTIDAGEDLIVNLLSPLSLDKLHPTQKERQIR